MNYQISYLLEQIGNYYYINTDRIKNLSLTNNDIRHDFFEIGLLIDFKEGSLKKQNRLITELQWTKLLSGITSKVLYSEEERQSFIYLLTFAQQFETSVFFFQDFLMVSKGTILNDIKRLRENLADTETTLDYSRKQGFTLDGPEFEIRRLAKNYIARMQMSDAGRFGLIQALNKINFVWYAQLRDQISQVMQKHILHIVPSRLEELIFYFGLSAERFGEKELILDTEGLQLEKMTAYQAAKDLLARFEPENVSTSEVQLVTILLTIVSQGEIQDGNLDFLLNIAAGIIHRLEWLAAIQFENYRVLLLNTFYHLVPAYFRIRFGFYLPNIMIDNIKRDYAQEYELTTAALRQLSQQIGYEVPEEEIGFFTILFGCELYNVEESQRKEPLKAVIVCPSGVSSSLILLTELQRIFPMITFKEANSVDQLKNIPESSYNIIFSTVVIKNRAHVYVVKPLMNQLEKNLLINEIQKDWFIPGYSLPNVKELVDALLPYVTLKKNVDKEKLYKVLNHVINKKINEKGYDRPMLKDLLTPEMIQITDQVLDWEEAITLSAETLLKNDYIEERYIQAIIDEVHQHGAFIHIGKGIALPHARPEDGVKKLGMSLLKSKEAVKILDEDKHAVNIFICLAAIDNETHLRALSSLTKVLTNADKLDQLLAAESKEEILNILVQEEA